MLAIKVKHNLQVKYFPSLHSVQFLEEGPLQNAQLSWHKIHPPSDRYCPGGQPLIHCWLERIKPAWHCVQSWGDSPLQDRQLGWQAVGLTRINELIYAGYLSFQKKTFKSSPLFSTKILLANALSMAKTWSYSRVELPPRPARCADLL